MSLAADLWDPEPRHQDGGDPEPAPRVLVVALAVACVLVLRKPDLVLGPQLWAEDGYTFFQDQYVHGLAGSLGRTWHGYWHVVPRLVAWVASLFPAAHAPRLYGAFAVLYGAVASSWIVRAEFRRAIPSDRLRVLAAFAIACAPTGRELIGCVANTNWYALWLGLLLAVAPFPARASGRALVVALSAAVGLSTPGAIAFLPIWIARAVLRTDRTERLLVLACVLPLVLELAGVHPEETGRTQAPLAPGAAVLGVARLFAWRYVSEPFLGEEDRLMAAERLGFPAVVISGALVATAGILAFLHGDRRARTWLAVVLGGAFASFLLACAGRPDIVRIASGALTTRGGGRYFFVPVASLEVLFVAALAHARGGQRALAGALVGLLALASAVTFRARPMHDLDWAGHVARLEQARAEKRTELVEIPVNPKPEKIRLRLVGGEPAPVDSSR